MIGEQDREWLDWVPEAERLIRAFESTAPVRLLSVLAATALLEPIARGLRDAYTRGLASRTDPGDR
jgi:hypothetical protein